MDRIDFEHAGSDGQAGCLYTVIWQSWIWWKRSEPKALSEEWSVWYWRTGWQTAARTQVLSFGNVNWNSSSLVLPQIYSTQACDFYPLSIFIAFAFSIRFIKRLCSICRLAGVTLVVPVINFWWPSFPPELADEAYKKQLKRDQWKLRIAHYAPGLLYWWLTQKWFPYSSILQRHPILFNKRDLETIQKMSQVPNPNEVELHFLP